MSRFFKGAVSSSDSSDAESSENEAPTRAKAPNVPDFSVLRDSDDESTKRVVKAHKERRFEELKTLIRQIKQTRNIKDMAKLLTLFEELCKLFDKTRAVMSREGLTTPRFYIRCMAELEDFLNEQWEDREARKIMSKANSKGLTTLRQKIRKYNKEMEAEVGAYREGPDPVGYSSAEGGGEDDEQDAVNDEQAPLVIEAKKPMKKVHGDDEDSDISSDEWSESEISSESDIDLEGQKMEDLRRFFLKKEFKTGDEREKKKVRKPREVKKEEVEEDEKEPWNKVPTTEERSRQLFPANAEITHTLVKNKLDEIIATRGRKSTNRKLHVRTLQDLFNIAETHDLGAGIMTKIGFAIIAGQFELNSRISDYMEFSTWNRTRESINNLLEILVTHPTVELSIRVVEDNENLSNTEEPYRVHGSLLMIVERLDTELTKILQNADCHSTDYIDKLKGEKDLCKLIEETQAYVDARQEKGIFQEDEICKIYMLRIEHLYYKYEADEADAQRAARLMDHLSGVIHQRDETKRLRQRAILCAIYQHALHDRWHKARDLMLMSHLQANIEHSDIHTQILYNRAICQIGLCAFRHGFIKDAHQCLSEIQNTQRSKELLAQGLTMRQQERTAEQEKLERARQVPYHMHVNVELMECVYLICSMLLEIPHMASHEYELRRKLLSRSFHYQLKQSEKCSLVGPPENTREHVVAASRAMLQGDWKKCRDFIVNDKMNTKVWNLFRNSDRVKEMVIGRIQEESLRTYLLMYSTVYTTVSLNTLAELFELEKKVVHSVISKMIIQEELSAALDEPTDCLIMHRVEPSRLQMLALHQTDKLTQLADANEQIIEPRTGRSGYTGPGTWYGQRGQDRGGDDKMRGQRGGQYQGDRRTGGDRYGQDKRGGGNAWNQNNPHRRRNMDKQRY